MNPTIFVLSTGRCGTQWLARFLDATMGASACVTHEPMHTDYAPRMMLGAKTPDAIDDEDVRAAIKEHVAWIREVANEKTYIECGHPAWSSLPFLIDTFAPDVRVIHLVRHPVPTSWSWLTHQAFLPPLAPHLAEKILLSPFDVGVAYPNYQQRWSLMAPFEKALFYWLEVNTLAVRLQRDASIPWLTVRFEDLFAKDAQQRILAFVGSSAAEGAQPGVVDDAHHVTRGDVDPALIEQHEEVMKLARSFGYDPLAYDAASLQARYTARLLAAR